MADDNEAIVIDNGSGTLKAGLASGDAPFSIQHAVGGKLDSSDLTYPVQHGRITNWDAMEAVWTNLFDDELREAASEHPILIADAPLVSKSQRTTMTEILFEKFKAPKLYFSNTSVLSLYAAGTDTGLVIDIGDGLSTAVPVVGNDRIVRDAVTKFNISGNSVTKYLDRLLEERGITLGESLSRLAKEKLCYVATDYEGESTAAESDSSIEKEYELPDGQTIAIGSERFRAPEVLFQPSLVGVESDGIHQLAYDSIMQCDIDDRKDMIQHILLVGGSSSLPGIRNRLKTELEALLPPNSRAKIILPVDPEHAAWSGGAKLAPKLQQQWMKLDDYEENGAEAVLKKCVN